MLRQFSSSVENYDNAQERGGKQEWQVGTDAEHGRLGRKSLNSDRIPMMRVHQYDVGPPL